MWNPQSQNGYAYVFPSTARLAWERLANTRKLPLSNNKLQDKLAHDDKFNIETIAVILSYYAQEVYGEGVDIPTLSLEDWKEVVAFYNAKMNTTASVALGTEYRNKVYEYLPYTEILLR